MRSRTAGFWMAVTAALIIASGAAPRATESATTGSGAAPEAERRDSSERYNDIALYIAGLGVPRTSSLSRLTQCPEWQQYAASAGANWAGFNRSKAQKISDWARAEIPDLHQSRRMLVYPFSGPDFLYAQMFFPQADTYVLLGLEPVGCVPDPENFQPEKIAPFFKMLDRAIADALTLSFFKTNDMADEINKQQPVSGTVPVLMLFLARTGHRIEDIRLFDISDNGTVCYRSGCAADAAVRPARGAELSFIKKGDTRKRKLVYISSDISDSGFIRRKNVRNFLEGLEPGYITYLKSASYLMHKNYFSGIRSMILRRSSAILQDDSGIPYRLFDRHTWNISLYGTYAGPIELFKVHLEKDLQEAYAENSKKLGFRLGYASRSNLLVARRVSNTP